MAPMHQEDDAWIHVLGSQHMAPKCQEGMLEAGDNLFYLYWFIHVFRLHIRFLIVKQSTFLKVQVYSI